MSDKLIELRMNADGGCEIDPTKKDISGVGGSQII